MVKQLIIIAIILFFSSQSFALSEGTYQVIIKKQQEKKNSRWSLADWMGTKKKIALMDQWLAIHSSSNNFEFALYGAKNNLDFSTGISSQDQSGKGNEIGFLGYYRIIGLEAKFEEIPNLIRDKNLMLGLRIFGRSDQGSHIKLLYGLNEMKDYQSGESVTQNIFGASSSIYLLPFLGIEGGYRKFLSDKLGNTSIDISGEAIEYGGFIEYSFVRIFGKLQEKKIFHSNQTSTTKKTYKTSSLGLKLYF